MDESYGVNNLSHPSSYCMLYSFQRSCEGNLEGMHHIVLYVLNDVGLEHFSILN